MTDTGAVWGLVVAAGRGSRFGDAQNKLWASLGGRPVLWHALQAFHKHPQVTGVVVVASEDCLQRTCELAAGFPLVHSVVQGGETRHQSVACGLQAIPDSDGLVLVHDAARPLISAEVITRVIAATRVYEAVIPVVPVPDTVCRVSPTGSVHAGPPREQTGSDGAAQSLARVQTPQGFSLRLLRTAYAQLPENEQPTDDAGVVARIHSVHSVEGDPRNSKLTWPGDLAMLEHALTREVRTVTGMGVDVHAFAPDRRLVLGGVTIPHEFGLLGHSDADVLVHALMDALLGAASMDDIGVLFPDTDPVYKDADSLELLQVVHKRLLDAGWKLSHADITVMAQTPKIRPHVPAMKARIASVLGCKPMCVNIKATTTEHLGFVGRCEGIAAMVVVTLIGPQTFG